MNPAGRLPILALALASACLAGLAPGTRAAPRSSAAPVLSPPAVMADARLVTLRNGVQLLLAPDTAATAVDVAVWSRAGTARERDGLAGIARLHESLVAAGPAAQGAREPRRLIAEAGGQSGSSTAADYACHYETVPPGALDLALGLGADRLGPLGPTPQAVADAARATGDEARRQAASQPWGPALHAFYGLAWGTHPYHRLPAGPVAGLERIAPADCEAWHAAAFAPDELLVTIVGRFDADQALAAAKRRLETLPRRRGPALAPRGDAAGGSPLVPAAVPPAQKAPRRDWRRLDVPLDLVIVGWKVPAHAAAETPALALLSRLLAAGPAQRLQRALLADSVGCVSVQPVLDARREGGLFYVMAAVKPAADSAVVERTLLAEMERLVREPVSDEELDRARRQEEVGALLGWQTPRGRADALGHAQLVDGDWRAAGLRHERTRRLTAADLQGAAARVLVPAGRNVLWVSTTRPDAPVGGRARPAPPSSEGGR